MSYRGQFFIHRFDVARTPDVVLNAAVARSVFITGARGRPMFVYVLNPVHPANRWQYPNGRFEPFKHDGRVCFTPEAHAEYMRLSQ